MTSSLWLRSVLLRFASVALRRFQLTCHVSIAVFHLLVSLYHCRHDTSVLYAIDLRWVFMQLCRVFTLYLLVILLLARLLALVASMSLFHLRPLLLRVELKRCSTDRDEPSLVLGAYRLAGLLQ